jgi:hypothetical protein
VQVYCSAFSVPFEHRETESESRYSHIAIAGTTGLVSNSTPRTMILTQSGLISANITVRPASRPVEDPGGSGRVDEDGRLAKTSLRKKSGLPFFDNSCLATTFAR